MGFFPLCPLPPFSGDLSSPTAEHANGGSRCLLQSKLCARGHWRPAEDAKLRELVSQHGPQNWNLIAEKLEGRSGKSCRLRWFNQLDPRINRRAFSEEEEERLLTAHRAHGNKWALIARLFPGRTDNAVKNHWHVITARKQREQSTSYRKIRKQQPSPASANNFHPECLILERNKSSQQNASCSVATESTITSNKDESVLSTSTDLSLGYNPFDLFFEAKAKLVLAPVEQCDSNSEASVAESVTNSSSNSNSDRERRKITSVPFIDFLGVGAA